MEDAIVDKVAARVWAAMSGRPIDAGRRSVVAVFSGAVSGFAAGREAVARLVRSQHELTVVMTPSARHIFGEGPLRQAGAAAIVELEPWCDVSDHIRRADIVLVPTLTMNFAARLALGLMDSPASTLVLGALLAGKSVLAIRDGADPTGKRGEALGAIPEGSPALWGLLEERLTTLERFGVELTSKSEFLFALERRLITPRGANRPAAVAAPIAAKTVTAGGASGFVTAADLVDVVPGSRVAIPAGRRLTPAAKETATRLGLTLECA